MTIEWTPVPEPVTWKLARPMEHGGIQYTKVTMSAPSSEDVLKGSAIPGSSGLDVTLRMIESASAERVPYEVLKKQPHWFNQQISDYMEEFIGAPAPDPLESWRAARREAQVREARAMAEEGAKSDALAKSLMAEAEAAVARGG